MASFELYGFEDLQDAISRIAEIPWEVMEDALDGMAEVAAAAIQAKGESMNIRDPESDVHILDKIKRRKPVKTDYGGLENIDFSGNRSRGDSKSKTANATIAFENEYGRRAQAARPFIGLALNENEDKIYAPAEKIIGDWIESEFSR